VAVRITRVIARLNIGGPAIQAISLTTLLEPLGYETRLVRGVEGADEGSMDDLAERLGVSTTLLPTMVRDPSPTGDLRALATLVRILRRDRPAIVHTHAAKGGTLGRVATVLAFPRRSRRPVVVHTYHGHSLSGYFSSRATSVYRAIERALARMSDALVCVSEEVRDDLVGFGVAPPERFVVVPLGLELSPFLDDADRAGRRAAVRQQWGVGPEEQLVTLVARLVPIKRVDRFLRAAIALDGRPGTRFAVVGDGELRDRLHADGGRQLGDRLVWAGFRRDMPDVCVASDVVVLCSDNEGTPVSLIEAQAAAVPVVGTDVGGVRAVVRDGETGRIVPASDEAALAAAVRELLDDPAAAARMGAAGREHVRARFAMERLVADLDALYRRLLAA
jgi:glycosyltransferase involved in cell wall biosynthesis